MPYSQHPTGSLSSASIARGRRGGASSLSRGAGRPVGARSVERDDRPTDRVTDRPTRPRPPPPLSPTATMANPTAKRTSATTPKAQPYDDDDGIRIPLPRRETTGSLPDRTHERRATWRTTAAFVAGDSSYSGSQPSRDTPLRTSRTTRSSPVTLVAKRANPYVTRALLTHLGLRRRLRSLLWEPALMRHGHY